MKKLLLSITTILFVVGLSTNPLTVASQSFSHPSTGLVVIGDVMHAASGNDYIGVVYSRSGSVYYNQISSNGIWGEEQSLGAGTEGRLAIDKFGNPHVVFTSSEKIAYFTCGGSEWSEVEFIESNNGGACSKPDVAVDGSGFAHITYTDTKGNIGDYYDNPDIMYAENTSGTFAKTIIFKGWGEFYGGSDRYQEFFNKGSIICLDFDGNYYVLTHKYQYQTWLGGNDKQYSIQIKSNLGSGGSSSASSDGFAIYDLDFHGTSVFALYKQTTFKTSALTVSGTTINFSNTQEVSTTTSVSSVAGNSTDLAVGGKNNTNLFTQFNDLGHVYADVVVKNTIVSVVEVGGVFYAVYTDNGDNKIKIREVAEPLSITRFEVPGQDGPAVIDGQAGTVDVKVEGGTDLTNLVATYATTSDVAGVSVETVPQTSAVTANDFSLPLTYTLSDGETSKDWLVSVSIGILDTIEIDICEGDSYEFGTQTLSVTGEYTETFIASNGSDSTVLLILSVNPTFNETIEANICQGESYSFDGQELSIAGTYIGEFSSAFGCDSTVTLILTVNQVYNHTDEKSICEGDSYVFGTQTLTTTGEYEETFLSVHGCDSTVMLTLTVNPVYNHIDEASICEGSSFIFGSQTLTIAGEYEETFPSISGCDSTVTLTLAVNPEYSQIVEANICEGSSFLFGSQTLTIAGEYEETFPSINGCDSTVTLTLTVNPVYNHTISVSICEGETYVFGTHTLTTTGEYEETFLSVQGCDSTVTLTLTVNPVYNHTGEVSICEGETYTFGMQSLTLPGEYEETFISVNGCDSTVTLTLTVNPIYNHTDEASICEGGTYVFGTQTLATSGEYEETFTSVSGCDSIVTLTLTVNPIYHVLYSGPGTSWDYLVNDSFEDVPTGSLAGWTQLYSGTGDANQKVVDTMAKNGTQSLQLEGQSNWASEYYKPIAGEHEKLVIEGWINVEKTLGGLTGGFGLADIDIGTWGTRTSRLQFYNGRINVEYQGGLTYNIQAYNPGEWYHVRMEHDFISKVYAVYINGAKVSGTSGSVTTDEFPMHPSITSKQFILFAGNSGTTKLFFDDLKMYESPVVEVCSNDLPFVFGEQQISESGTYTETFQTVHGCDSTVTLTLAVNPVYNGSDEVSVCENDFPYTYDDNEFLAAGVYDIVYQAENGCDSTITLTLVSLPVYDQSLEVTVYENDLPYLFGGDEIFEAGEYQKTFASVSGCDSTVTVNLTISTKDITPPEAACQPIEVLLNVSGNYTLTNADILQLAAGSSDNKTVFENLLITVTPKSFDCEDAGTYVPVEVSVSDEEGNTDICTTSVHVIDNIVPLADCVSNTFELDETGEVTISADDLCQSFDDACGISEKSVNPNHFTCDDLGENMVKVTVKDNHGNTIAYMVKVTIIDNLAPSFALIQDMELVAEEGKCSAQIEYPEITAYDNCQVESIYLINGWGVGAEFPIGTNVEQWVAKDLSGNTDTLTFTVTVSGNPVAPYINLVDDISVLEDAAPFTIPLSGITGGYECETYPLEFGLTYSNDWLISSYQIDYTQGETNGTLTLVLTADAFGESDVTLTLTNTGTDKQKEVTFKLKIQPVNDPPFVLVDIDDIDKTTKDTLMVMIPTEIGAVFGDPDPDDLLQVTVSMADGSVLPSWLACRNDSLIAITTPSTGCLDLLAKATDMAGEETSLSFSLCISFPTGTNTLETEVAISVYPNPTSGKVFLKTQNISGDEVKVEVFDLTGRKVLSTQKKLAENMEIDLSNQVSGAYFLKVESKGFQKTFKIIVKH